MFATLCWSGNFIIGKFAYLFEVPPLTLNFLRWVSVWIILIPFTYKEIFNNFNYIKKNWMVISFMGVITISTFNSVVYFALNYTQVINAVLVLAAIPAVVAYNKFNNDSQKYSQKLENFSKRFISII